MAHLTPHVEQGTLTLRNPDAEEMIAVGTSAWFTWLETATAFTFACADGTFTARRERSSSGRSTWYWRAYQHRTGTRRRAYLGKAAELSLGRLHTVAAQLANAGILEQAPDRAGAGGAAPLAVSREQQALPSGTVTFLFTDIVGSTQLWELHHEAMGMALARHDTLLRQAIDTHGGVAFKTVGDSVHAVFARAPDAFAAALDAQRALQQERWDSTGPLRVRMALHSGAAELRENDYFGPPLNRAARILALGHGNQILLSRATHDLVADDLPANTSLRALGDYHLKDLNRPEPIFQCVSADLPADFPPLRTDNPRSSTGVPSPQLLATKLYMPRARPDLVARARLFARLDAGLPGMLTLVCAPAGFGKTTLLAEWLRRTGRPAAWLGLDAGDNDPAVFLRYLVAALQTLVPEVGATMLTLLQSPPPPLETLLTVLLNDLARLPQNCILVLDDYHVLAAPPNHQAVGFLLDHLPPALHLVIATREDPPLPLARLRARGQIVELRADQLRFTADEAAVFLTDVMGLPLTAADVAALEARTEGWVAGLQLAALAMHDRDDYAGFIAAFTGSHRFVLDYLADEVLRSQPSHIQTFLLQTSILDRMCGPLCDAVMGIENEKLKIENEPSDRSSSQLSILNSQFLDAYSQRLLEQLERANLFVTPLDAERRWYRYHHLFAEVLRERLRRGAASAEVATLHLHASAWYAQHGSVPDAIQHALAAEAPDVAAQLIEAHGQRLIARGELLSLTRWLRLLPDTSLRARPRLLVLLAWLLPNTGALADVARYRAEAEALLADNPDPVLRSEFLALQLQPLIFQDRTDEVIALGRQVLDHLPAEHFFHSVSGVITGLAYLRQSQLAEAERILSVAVAEAREKQALFFLVSGLARLAMIAVERGEFARAEQFSAEALAECRGPNGILSPIAGMALVGLGRLRGWQGRLDDATRTLEESLELCGQLNAAPFFFLDGYTGLADLHLAQGRFPEALHQLALAEERVHRFANPAFMATIAAHRASIWRAQGNHAFIAWLNDRHPRSEEPLTAVRDKEYVTLVRGLIDTNQVSVALRWIDRLAAFAHDTGRIRSEVDMLVLRVMALQHQGEARTADTALARALALAAPMGYVSIFVEEGAPMAALLREAHTRGIAPSYVEKLLAAFGELKIENEEWRKVATQAHSQFSILNSQLPEPLTTRELEVLRLLAAGASNGVIAEALVISIGTAKKHVNNILAKLDVRSRTQAAIWARDHGLLTERSVS
jgi:LuxR family transcriptional regulator, maltose regulon positive regulatory protein